MEATEPLFLRGLQDSILQACWWATTKTFSTIAQENIKSWEAAWEPDQSIFIIDLLVSNHFQPIIFTKTSCINVCPQNESHI
jgi:hypothetical protein